MLRVSKPRAVVMECADGGVSATWGGTSNHNGAPSTCKAFERQQRKQLGRCSWRPGVSKCLLLLRCLHMCPLLRPHRCPDPAGRQQAHASVWVLKFTRAASDTCLDELRPADRKPVHVLEADGIVQGSEWADVGQGLALQQRGCNIICTGKSGLL